jgi:hypothetical protein
MQHGAITSLAALLLLCAAGSACAGQPPPATVASDGRLPTTGSLVYSSNDDLFGVQHAGMRGRRPGSDRWLTQTDHRLVSAVSADGRLMIVVDYHQDRRGGTYLRWLQGRRIHSRRLAPAGSIAELCGSRAVVLPDAGLVVDVRARTRRRFRVTHRARAAACSPDARLMAVVGDDGSLRLGQADGRLRPTPLDAVTAVRWAPAGPLVAACAEGGLVLVAADGGVRVLAAAMPSCDLAWAPDGRRIAFRSPAGALRVVDLAGGLTTAAPQGALPVWSPDGSSLAYWNVSVYAGRVDSGRQVTVIGDPGARPIAWLDTEAAKRAVRLRY